ncbi:unnamed protein product [Blepharisma stoltei]|uniref:DNA polymerase kappa n=1 Tax=Blepharisma stoltei TaxID=1481888 RepID=A0AAU9IEW6_9CILI|nr:unnamed protein product [Blepharisma stoltei]
MKGINRDKIDRIIYEASKNTDYFKHEQHKIDQIKKKANSMKNEIQKNIAKGPRYIKVRSDEIDQKLRDYEKERELSETWIHIDMDMFYASVEIRDNPELADKPIAVGDYQMITTANYIARRFGVRSAMPGFIGQRLCPDLIFVPPNFSKYHCEGEKIREIFKEYDQSFESLGLDEASLWVTPVLKDRGLDTHEGRQALANEIREKIFTSTQLTASAGIASNKLLAKMATEINKPNGQFYLQPEKAAIIDFIEKQNVRKVPGCGKVLEKLLNELGVKKCQDILKKKLEISFVFNETSLVFLLKSALGLGPTHHPQSASEEHKSVSISRTFPPTGNLQEIEEKLKSFCETIAKELEEKDAECKNLTVTIKTLNYEVINRSETSKKFIHKLEDITKLALKQLELLSPIGQIRLLGLKANNLSYGRQKRKSQNNRSISEPQQKTSKEEFVNSFLHTSIKPDKMENEEPKPSGVKLMRLQCPNCGEWYTMSEYRMNIHISSCNGEDGEKRKSISLDFGSKNKKANKGLTLDHFFARK